MKQDNFINMATDASVKHNLASNPFSFYEFIDPLEMAKQMTLIDFQHFCLVKVKTVARTTSTN